jgi:hypothetical protein
MTDRDDDRDMEHQPDGPEGRRFKLRLLLLSAADAARHGRRVSAAAARARDPAGRAIRDRVSMLLRAS